MSIHRVTSRATRLRHLLAERDAAAWAAFMCPWSFMNVLFLMETHAAYEAELGRHARSMASGEVIDLPRHGRGAA